MMNPDVLLDLARERRRDLLEDAARYRRTRKEVEPAAETLTTADAAIAKLVKSAVA